jgi:HJR/Mrr/RecB family endonuclease
MSRRRKSEDSDVIVDMGVLLVAVGIFWLVMKFRENKGEFWQYIALFILLIVTGVGICFYWRKRKTRRLEDLLKQIKEKGHEEGVKIFIAQEGRVKTKNNIWSYDGYDFDEKHLERSKNQLINDGVKVSLSDLKWILQHYIDDQGVKQIKGIFDQKVAHHSFSELMNGTGVDFENLIARLYEAMGYATKRNGGSGDQGADVIAHKNGEHILIQAKCWEGGVSNKAVQQAHSASPFYGCNKAVVVTTSFFTQGAIDLAKADSVELIDQKRLRQMLLDHLHESWS